MKSFFDLCHEWNFALPLAVALILAGWDLAYGTKIIGILFLLVIFVTVFANLKKTRDSRRKTTKT